MASVRPLPVRGEESPGEIDRQGFASVYERYYSRLIRYCARLSSPQVAEEVAQETMTRALASLDRFDPSRPLWPWLKTIAINLVRDMGRRAGRELAAAHPAISHPHDPTQSVEDRALLEMALARLSARQRTAIGLRYVNGWEPVQIGSHLGLSPSAARQLLLRARTRLRMEFRSLADTAFGFFLAPWTVLRRKRSNEAPASWEPATSAAVSYQAAHGLLTGVIVLALVFTGGVGDPRAGGSVEIDQAHAPAPGGTAGPRHEPSRPRPDRGGPQAISAMPASSGVEEAESVGSGSSELASPPPPTPPPAQDAEPEADDSTASLGEPPAPSPPPPSPPTEDPEPAPDDSTLIVEEPPVPSPPPPGSEPGDPPPSEASQVQTKPEIPAPIPSVELGPILP